jgi:uncharacterized protein (TIGR00251 family)
VVRLRVQPRASRDEIAGWREGALAVRVTAPPVEGEANRAVVELLARALAVPRRTVSVVHGERGRDKLVRIDGLSLEDVERRLSAGDRMR